MEVAMEKREEKRRFWWNLEDIQNAKTRIEDEARQVFEKIKKGEEEILTLLRYEELQKILQPELYLESVKNIKSSIEKLTQSQIESLLSRLNIATKNDVNALKIRLTNINKKLDRIIKKLEESDK